MKSILLMVSVLSFSLTSIAFAKPLNAMKCSELKNELRAVEKSHNTLFHESEATGDSDELEKISDQMLFLTARLAAIRNNMNVKGCAIPASQSDTYSEAKEKACMLAIDGNDYAGYVANCR